MATTVTSIEPRKPSERVGDTWVRDYDLAVVKALGAFQANDDMFTHVEGVDPPTYSDDYQVVKLRRQRMPGIPIVFAGPADAFEHAARPQFLVRRQDPELAMERWTEQNRKFTSPAADANPVTIVYSTGIGQSGPRRLELTGYDKYEEQRWPWAYDMNYTISFQVEGKQAEGKSIVKLLKHLVKCFPPRGSLTVVDSEGIPTLFAMFVDAPTSLNEVIDVANRVRGWAVNARILGYLDTEDPYIIGRDADSDHRIMVRQLITRLSQK